MENPQENPTINYCKNSNTPRPLRNPYHIPYAKQKQKPIELIYIFHKRMFKLIIKH